EHPERDRPPAGRADAHPGDDDGEHHARRADLVPPPGVRRVGQEAQREDERHDRDQVQQVGEVRAHVPLPSREASTFFAGSRFLNISSMRSVTTKPPTTFAEASTTATKPTTHVNASLWSRPSTSIAPTMTMP